MVSTRHVKMRKFCFSLYFVPLFLLLLTLLYSANSIAGNRFDNGYSCIDTKRECMDSGTRTIENIEVTPHCWEWAYTRTCKVPSKDNCHLYGYCYSFGQKDCLLRDSYGNCINVLKEFSCERWVPAYIESDEVKKRYSEKEAAEELVCRGIPCLDGNCVDKSYQMDEDMLDSVSKLYALAQGVVKDNAVSLFAGSNMHCSNKMLDSMKCCNISPKGWMQDFGARCSNAEKLLARKRADNLCIFAQETSSKTAGVVTVRKKHYCCFSNIIEKVFQEQVRRQLGTGFVQGGNTDCRGLTLEELFDPRVDFSKMDFSEIAADIAGKMKLPGAVDAENRVISAMDNIHRFNKEVPHHQDNRFAGINSSLIDEQSQEAKIAAENAEKQEHLARLEAERLEKERLAKIAEETRRKEQLAAQEKQRLLVLNQKREAKQREIDTAQKQYEALNKRHSDLYWEWARGNEAQRAKWTKHWGRQHKKLGVSRDEAQARLKELKDELARIK